MIVIPTRGMARSVQAHNVSLDVLAEWIEASVLFTDDELSRTDVCDRLVEEEKYESQDFAKIIVNEAWDEISRRERLCTGAYALTVDGDWVRRTDAWDARPAHVFCTLLSISGAYDWWVEEFGRDYTEQGELFEELTANALNTIAPDWRTYLTGWSKSNTEGFKSIANEVTKLVGIGDPDLDLWDDDDAKDMTLDILFYRPFPDGRQGFPYFMVQCASGANWPNKIRDPDLNVWSNIVRPITKPMRGVAIPYCCSERDFHQYCVKTEGLLLDRCRLLSASQLSSSWLPNSIGDRIKAWAQPRVDKILSRSN